MADGDVHYETETLLRGFGLDLADVGVIHSTSWRPDGPAVVLTYMAVVKAAGYVLETWPDAAPVTASLPAAVGKAPPTVRPRCRCPAWSTCCSTDCVT